VQTRCTVLPPFSPNGTTFDGLAWLGAYRADHAAHAVRLVCFPVGPTVYRYITTVTDPR